VKKHLDIFVIFLLTNSYLDIGWFENLG